MGLRINKSIGTSEGITKTAYVRLGDIQVGKTQVNASIHIFQKQEDAEKIGIESNQGTATQSQIGRDIVVSLFIEEPEKQEVPVLDAEGAESYDKDGNLKTRHETIMKRTPINQEIYSESAHTFLYRHLKEKLVGLFGDNIEDC